MKKCPFCAEEIQNDAIKCKHCGTDLRPRPVSVMIKRIKRLADDFLHNKIAIIVLASLILVLLLGVGSVWAYSEKLIIDGDKMYKEQKYSESLVKYQEAYRLMGVLKINHGVVGVKITKANIMIKSTENYQAGLDAFNIGQYDKAKRYFSLMAERDLNQSNVQKILNQIDSLISNQYINIPTSTPANVIESETQSGNAVSKNVEPEEKPIIKALDKKSDPAIPKPVSSPVEDPIIKSPVVVVPTVVTTTPTSQQTADNSSGNSPIPNLLTSTSTDESNRVIVISGPVDFTSGDQTTFAPGTTYIFK